MYCPRCGTVATPNQQFCRACGLSLEKVVELVGEGVELQSSPTDRSRLRERQQKFENLAGIAGLTTFGVILLLFIILIFSQIILKGGLLIIPGTLLILLAFGAGVMVFFQVYSKSLKAKLEEPSLPRSTEPLSTETSRRIPLAPASVSEGTTELLAPTKGVVTGEINDPGSRLGG